MTILPLVVIEIGLNPLFVCVRHNDGLYLVLTDQRLRVPQTEDPDKTQCDLSCVSVSGGP